MLVYGNLQNENGSYREQRTCNPFNRQAGSEIFKFQSLLGHFLLSIFPLDCNVCVFVSYFRRI